MASVWQFRYLKTKLLKLLGCYSPPPGVSMGFGVPVRFVSFAPFQLYLRNGELRRAGIKVRVPDESIKVLAKLVEAPGEIVTRQQLHQKLSPNRTIVEYDFGINSAVKRLRQALE